MSALARVGRRRTLTGERRLCGAAGGPPRGAAPRATSRLDPRPVEVGEACGGARRAAVTSRVSAASAPT